MLSLFAGHAQFLTGLDQSREMLAIARGEIAKQNLKNAQVRQADIYALPLVDHSADLVLIHQVLHFLDDPQRALAEAGRILSPQGRVLVADFAPHEVELLREEHAHRRLGISEGQMDSWLARSGLQLIEHRCLPPPGTKLNDGLTVSLWLAGPNDADVSINSKTKVAA
jgi:ubiquinone/menaquinone biosynthesis C-methylase UbiE